MGSGGFLCILDKTHKNLRGNWVMKIFYEGLDVEKYAQHPAVEGFITNCTFFSRGDCKNYTEFYGRHRDRVGGKRCLSLQTWEYGDLGIAQMDAIYAIDPTLYIDIPILDCNNDINERVICYAVSKNMRINITAVYTYTHISIAYDYIKKLKNDAIISVFAGGISDSGLDPSPFIAHAKRLFREMPNVKILWAGCRELYTIKCAEESGCDIIALPGGLLDTLHLVDSDLDKMSVGMVYGWRNDAIDGGLSI